MVYKFIEIVPALKNRVEQKKTVKPVCASKVKTVPQTGMQRPEETESLCCIDNIEFLQLSSGPTAVINSKLRTYAIMPGVHFGIHNSIKS